MADKQPDLTYAEVTGGIVRDHEGKRVLRTKFGYFTQAQLKKYKDDLNVGDQPADQSGETPNTAKSDKSEADNEPAPQRARVEPRRRSAEGDDA